MSSMKIKIVCCTFDDYRIYDNETDELLVSCTHPDYILFWLGEQNCACEVEYVNEAETEDDEEDFDDYEDEYLEMGFNPYAGCYDFDC